MSECKCISESKGLTFKIVNSKHFEIHLIDDLLKCVIKTK